MFLYMVRYAEIGLKKKNRTNFEMQLKKNIVAKTNARVKRTSGRFIVDSQNNIDSILKKIPGIASFSYIIQCNNDIEKIKQTVMDELKDRTFQSFGIKSKRSDKEYPLKSPEINVLVGSFIKESLDVEVNLTNPDVEVGIDILHDKAYIYTDKVQCMGGLPVGTGGKVLSLLSGGIDSPVSSILMMKRGCSVDFIHFHNFPYVSKKSIDKAKKLFRKVNEYQASSRLILIPFTPIQKEIVTKCPAKLRIILYRRMMLRIAERFMGRHKALVSGENLAQVSSQTLTNMRVVNASISQLILRPLVGMDKRDIIDLAEKYGTYEISIEPHEDCCTYFVPRKPETSAKFDEVLEAEKQLDIENLIRIAKENHEVFKSTDD